MTVWLTPREVAERTRFTPKTLANWRALGTGPEHVKVGTRIRYDEAVVNAWMADRS